jgi:hypothetical protein
MKTLFAVLTLSLAVAAHGGGLQPRTDAAARGLGINVPLVARVTGATLYITALDVSNHSSSDVQVDFYFDGVNTRTGTPVTLTGSITAEGPRPEQGGVLRKRSNVHMSDFFASLVAAGMLPAETSTHGFVGSALFVFNGLNRSGQAAVTARFRNNLNGGTVGVALRGRELTGSEPQRLVVAVRDTRGNTRNEPQLYPNLFINHIGLTPSGSGNTAPVTVELSAVSNRTGEPIGATKSITIESGRTATINSALAYLEVPQGADDTILFYARVTAGNAAIHGIVSQVDAVTRDGSVFEMTRADF